MRKPLPLVAVLYAGGLILAQHTAAAGLNWLFPLAMGLGLTALACNSARGILLLLLLPVAGWTNLLARTSVLSPHDLRLLVADRVEFVTLRGTLRATPVLRISRQRNRQFQRSMVEMDVTALFRAGHWQPAFGRVVASTPGVLDGSYFSGCPVEATGVLQTPPGPVAPGQFDYRGYLRAQGIYYQLRCDNTNDWSIVQIAGRTPGTPPLSDRFCRWAQSCLARGLPEEDESLRLLWAMVLGWKTALTPDVTEPFMQSGTLHIFAISGLHIALIAGILVSVLRVLQVPRSASGILVIPLIWFYTAATGWQASAIRSTVMMTVVIAGWALERPSNLVNSLSAAGLIILIWQPTQLFQASFQLSFFVVLGIALIVPPLEKARQKLLAPDPLLPPELRPRWQRWLDWPIRVVTTSLATSLAAWLGSMPLIAYYFYMITPGSLLANLVIVPLSSMALASSLGSLVCGSWCSLLTELFNHSSWLWTELMIRLSHWFAALPGAYFYVRQPDLVEFVIYSLLLGGLLSGFCWAPRRRLWAGAGAVALVVVWAIRWHCEQVGTLLTVLPARAGVIFVDAPGSREDLLIDCGDPAIGDSIVKSFLRSQGVNWVAGLLLSHGDLAHVGATEMITSRFGVRQILTGPTRARSPAYRQLLDRLERTPGKCRVVQRGSQACGWNILHPEAQDRFARGDDGAMVLRRQCHGTDVLLLSDLGRLGQRKLLERETNLRAEILVAGLSNKDFLSDALLDAVQPRLLIVASAEYPVANRPSRQLRDRLARRNIPIVYTSEAGAAVVRFGPEGWQIKTMDGRRARAEALAPYLPDGPGGNESDGAVMSSESDG